MLCKPYNGHLACLSVSEQHVLQRWKINKHKPTQAGKPSLEEALLLVLTAQKFLQSTHHSPLTRPLRHLQDRRQMGPPDSKASPQPPAFWEKSFLTFHPFVLPAGVSICLRL